MNIIGGLIVLGIVVTIGQIAWQVIMWSDPLKEMRKR